MGEHERNSEFFFGVRKAKHKVPSLRFATNFTWLTCWTAN
jgi:hypothetical protein